MSEREATKEKLVAALQREIRLPYQAAALGYQLFSYFRVCPDDAAGLICEFHARLQLSGMSDVREQQMRYAAHLAAAPRLLEYEEMHKLLSLCDEIEALGALGLSASEHMKDEFENAVRERFHREPGKARMAAEDRVENWNRRFWWYAETLSARFG